MFASGFPQSAFFFLTYNVVLVIQRGNSKKPSRCAGAKRIPVVRPSFSFCLSCWHWTSSPGAISVSCSLCQLLWELIDLTLRSLFNLEILSVCLAPPTCSDSAPDVLKYSLQPSHAQGRGRTFFFLRSLFSRLRLRLCRAQSLASFARCLHVLEEAESDLLESERSNYNCSLTVIFAPKLWITFVAFG